MAVIAWVPPGPLSQMRSGLLQGKDIETVSTSTSDKSTSNGAYSVPGNTSISSVGSARGAAITAETNYKPNGPPMAF